ncbi:PREDICTED: LOW QUALITY PROTEIN: protein PXR1-like [Atta cephalotes]|uniref:Uncharacterized protein n=1 Tax=Atta cephalotes TaxID=12957 RepID=A0A158NTM3_ATTCE|nr:PREDICTED: LOW QUALITY PROTEIN: protein PXR1-like [Atta cephalotes]
MKFRSESLSPCPDLMILYQVAPCPNEVDCKRKKRGRGIASSRYKVYSRYKEKLGRGIEPDKNKKGVVMSTINIGEKVVIISIYNRGSELSSVKWKEEEIEKRRQNYKKRRQKVRIYRRWRLGKIDRREYMEERKKFKELKEKKQKEREKKRNRIERFEERDGCMEIYKQKRGKRIWRDNNIETEEWRQHFMNLLSDGKREKEARDEEEGQEMEELKEKEIREAKKMNKKTVGIDGIVDGSVEICGRAYKWYAEILRIKLEEVGKKNIIPKTQIGFKKGRSTMDGTYSY